MMGQTKLKFSPYAPIRFQNEFWWLYSVDVAKRGFVVADGSVVVGLSDLIMKELVTPIITNRMTPLKEAFPDKELLGSVAGHFMAKMMEQKHWVPLIAQYTLCGRQIFDLADDLVEMLAHTDFGDCTLESWNPPYDAMFVRFGKCDEVFDFDTWFERPDGAFVAVTPWDDTSGLKLIKIGFTTVKADGSGVVMPGYFLDIEPGEQRLPVKEAMELAMARRMTAFDDQPSDSESVRALNSHRRQEVMDCGDMLKQVLALMVNALFYLESAGRDGKLGPGRDTPPELTAQWGNSIPRQREKLKSKLLSSGYSTVYLMGAEYGKDNISTKSAGTKRVHWRRGHWRRQHHGEGKSLVKRIWMKPQMIGGSQVHDDMPGHVYIVGSAGDTKH